jgi:hypothetical protein
VDLSREVWGCPSDSGVVAMLFSSALFVRSLPQGLPFARGYKAFIIMYGQMTLNDVRSNIEMFSLGFLTLFVRLS